MKKGVENMNKNTEKNVFYKTNPRGGISLIVLVITIIVVIILAAAVIISLQNNNPMVEANKARIESDVANMQSIFTNTVGKIMAENQDVVQVVGGQLYTTPTGNKKTIGEATYKIIGADGTVAVEGKIIFGTGEKLGTTYYTGKELPLYSSDTKWSVDNQGLLSVEVGGVLYGEGANTDNPSVDLKEEIEITNSDNPMLQYWDGSATTDFHSEEYRTKISKIKFAITDKVPGNRVEQWDVSNAKDKSVMAWVEDDGNNGYILTIAGKEKIIANPNSSFLFLNFNKVVEMKNLELLDTSNLICMQATFYGCSSLINIDLSSFNTSNVTAMNYMFYGCSNLTNIDLSSFNTSNVTTMSCMFYNCSSLTSINFGDNFDTSKVNWMDQMFYMCSNIISLDLSKFDTSNVDYISSMFAGCSKLTNLSFDSFGVGYNRANSVFSGCSNLTATFTIRKGSTEQMYMFNGAATNPGALITLNYAGTMSDESMRSLLNASPGRGKVVIGVKVE